MIITTGNDVAGHQIVEYLGIVRGIVVRSTGAVSGLKRGLRAIAGGNSSELNAICEEARGQAYDRMVHHANKLSADAIIGVRYDASEFLPGTTEVLAYGTAVKIQKE